MVSQLKQGQEHEDATLAANAEKRFSQKVKYISHKDIIKKFGLSNSDLNDVEVNLEFTPPSPKLKS